jgi:hypothetical protein
MATKKEIEEMCFEELVCSILKLEASPGLNPSCQLNFFSFFSHQNPGSGLGSSTDECKSETQVLQCFFEQRSDPFAALLLISPLPYQLSFINACKKTTSEISEGWYCFSSSVKGICNTNFHFT